MKSYCDRGYFELQTEKVKEHVFWLCFHFKIHDCAGKASSTANQDRQLSSSFDVDLISLFLSSQEKRYLKLKLKMQDTKTNGNPLAL